MNEKNNIISLTQKHVFNLFKEGAQKGLVYHNYNHTLDVVMATDKIGNASGLSKSDLEIVTIAAWFHDTGYTKKCKGHESESVTIASNFLREQNFEEEKISKIASVINATQYPQKPTCLLDEILCDADFSHFGEKNYLDKSELLRLEWSLMNEMPDEYNWPVSDINFLLEHNYHTEFAQKEFANRKYKNVLALQKISGDLTERELKDKKKDETPEKGIETMFRVSFRNHMQLSAIADSKANIMLSINAIIISISLSSLIPNFDDNPGLIIPTMVLLLVSIVTIIFATLSTVPKINSGIFTREDVKKKKPNLLFFGNFHAMPLNEFEWGMKELMKSKDYLYGSLIKDFYSLGTVLAKKYRYLRVCYNIFMYGMILSVTVFLVTFLI